MGREMGEQARRGPALFKAGPFTGGEAHRQVRPRKLQRAEEAGVPGGERRHHQHQRIAPLSGGEQMVRDRVIGRHGRDGVKAGAGFERAA